MRYIIKEQKVNYEIIEKRNEFNDKLVKVILFIFMISIIVMVAI